jgi:hypothetical protein
LIVFDRNQKIAARINNMLANMSLAEHGITGYQTPFQGNALE